MEEEIFAVYGMGIIYCSVCSNLSLETILERLNKEYAPGTSMNEWIFTDKPFDDNTPNPCQCPNYPSSKHYLFNC